MRRSLLARLDAIERALRERSAPGDPVMAELLWARAQELIEQNRQRRETGIPPALPFEKESLWGLILQLWSYAPAYEGAPQETPSTELVAEIEKRMAADKKTDEFVRSLATSVERKRRSAHG
jgi:hypothetical protein